MKGNVHEILRRDGGLFLWKDFWLKACVLERLDNCKYFFFTPESLLLGQPLNCFFLCVSHFLGDMAISITLF